MLLKTAAEDYQKIGSKSGKTMGKKNTSKIALFFLPSYSPERNHAEYLNCDLKYGLSQKVMQKNDEQLKKNVQSHMKLLQRKPDRVIKYFKHQSIKYAA